MAQTTGAQFGNPFADHQEEQDISEPPRAGFKKYYMHYTTSRLNVRLHNGSMTGPVEYYLQTALTLTSPQLRLRRGDNKKSPMVAFCKLQNTSRHALLGRGDLDSHPEAQLVWEELHREKNALRRSDYQFGTSEGDTSLAGGRRAQFFWRKDRGRVNRSVFDCVDEQGNVVARMLSGGAFNWKRGGDIDMLEGLPQGLEEFLLISAIAIWTYEALAYQSLLQGFDKDDKKSN